jgi:hypothetical protein
MAEAAAQLASRNSEKARSVVVETSSPQHARKKTAWKP